MSGPPTIAILYEDDHILAIDKPAGMPTMPSPSRATGTLAGALARMRPGFASLEECGIVHRLDNDTSGIVCAAKTSEAYETLRARFSQGAVDKRYIALVMGSMDDRGETHAPIAHHPRKHSRMVVCESPARSHELKGRPATTSWRVVARYHYMSQGMLIPYTLIETAIATGVRHQIRAHLAWLGFPIAGDRLYQNAKKRAEDVLLLKRHFLHAHRLTLAHPVTHAPVVIESKLPHDLKRALASLTLV